MSYDFHDPKFLKRAIGAIEDSRKRLRPYRRIRKDAIDSYAGSNYNDDSPGATSAYPVNMLALGVNIFTRQLAAKNPAVLVTTDKRHLKPHAENFRLRLNQLFEEIKLEETLYRWVMDAMFGIGIIKTGIAAQTEVEYGGYTYSVGQPYADTVDLDDWVIDMSAKRFEQAAFMGNRYRLPLEVVKDSDLFIKKARNKLVATEKISTNEDGEDRAESIGMGSATQWDELEPHVELWDLWFPRSNVMCTLPADESNAVKLIEDGPLRVVDWDGPEAGPYIPLGFGWVPNCLMPLPPIAHIIDLNDLINRLMRKLGDQADRQKTVYAARLSGMNDARTTRDAQDGEIVGVDNTQSVVPMNIPGADPNVFAFTIQLRELCSYMFGNLDLVGGLGPAADTYGQDKLLSATSSKMLQEMQDRVMGKTTDLIKSLAWYEWTDPVRQSILTKTFPGTNQSIPVKWSPETREGDFIDYNFSIHPYSMVDQSPSDKMAVLREVYGIVASNPQMLAAQGGMLDMRKLLELAAKYRDFDELNELIVFASSQQQEMMVGGTDSQPKPAETKRTYERINRPGVTRSAQEQAMASMLKGQNLQPKEQNAAFRAVG